nr:unnamed protein product [Callosobruchus chinensis]
MMVVKEEPVSPAELSGGPNPAKKPKLYDLSDPKFLKPFDYGWKRELVYRSTGGTTTKRMGDIYYYTPQGKRSMREVSENLHSRYLTMENFTFFKESLGLNDTEKEVIRDAKVGKGSASSSFTSDSSPSKILSPKLKPSGLVKKAIEKAASTNRATPRSPKLAAASSKAAASPKAAPSPKTSPRRVQSPKVQSPKVLSPKMRSPKMQTPKVQSPKVHSPRVGLSSAINEATDSPASSERSLRGKSANQAKMKGKLKLKAPVKKEKKANSKTDEEMKTEPPAKSPPAKRGRWSNSEEETQQQPQRVQQP